MMLPQCSHITRKRGVYYYRRRLPKPLTGGMALRSAPGVSCEPSGWRTSLTLCLHEPSKECLTTRTRLKSPASSISGSGIIWTTIWLDGSQLRHSPVYASVDDGEDPVAADLAWVDAELDAAKAELTERLYEYQRPLIDYLMEEHKLPEEQWKELAFAVFHANVKKWETIRKRTLGDFETLGPSALSPLRAPANA